jgi:hypothetical protein
MVRSTLVANIRLVSMRCKESGGSLSPPTPTQKKKENRG